MVSSEACGQEFLNPLFIKFPAVPPVFAQVHGFPCVHTEAFFPNEHHRKRSLLRKIQINLGILILEIIEIQKSLGSHNPHAHSGDLSGDGAFRELSLLNKTVAG